MYVPPIDRRTSASTSGWSTSAPAEGTTKVFSVAVPAPTTRPYHLSVIDRATGASVQAAVARIDFGDGTGTKLRKEVDPAGCVHLRLPMSGTLHVGAEGYGLRSFAIPSEAVSPTGVVCLSRYASISGVLPSGLPAAGNKVFVRGLEPEGEAAGRDEGWPAEGRAEAARLLRREGAARKVFEAAPLEGGGWAIRGIEVPDHAARLVGGELVLRSGLKAAVLKKDVTLTPGQDLVIPTPHTVELRRR